MGGDQAAGVLTTVRAEGAKKAGKPLPESEPRSFARRRAHGTTTSRRRISRRRGSGTMALSSPRTRPSRRLLLRPRRMHRCQRRRRVCSTCKQRLMPTCNWAAGRYEIGIGSSRETGANVMWLSDGERMEDEARIADSHGRFRGWATARWESSRADPRAGKGDERPGVLLRGRMGACTLPSRERGAARRAGPSGALDLGSKTEYTPNAKFCLRRRLGHSCINSLLREPATAATDSTKTNQYVSTARGSHLAYGTAYGGTIRATQSPHRLLATHHLLEP